MQYTIKADLLAAAFICINNKDPRYYLHGVYMDKTRLATTDGHRLFVGDVDEGMDDKFIIPYDTLKAAIPSIKKAETIVIEKYHEEYVMIVGEHRYVFTPVDGQFPDYARLIPNAIEESPSHFNPKYINDVGKMSKILTNHECRFRIFQSGTNPAGIKFLDRNDCVSVLMPMQTDGSIVW